MTFVLKQSASQLLTLFAIFASGYLVGRIRIRGIGLGTAAVFLSALAFGHFGFTVPDAMQTMGLILFIVSVGLSAGPAFVSRLRTNGAAYAILCVTIALAGAAVCALIVFVGKIDAPLAVGMMTGAFTTSPGFAAAKEAVAADADAVGRVAAGYGIIYPIGVVGKVLFIQLLPKLLHVDMAYERSLIAVPKKSESERKTARTIKIDTWGLFPFSLSVVLGILLGSVIIPLPGGGTFTLGTTGGPLIIALLLGHIGRIGPIDLTADPRLFGPTKEIGLILFLAGSGIEGGRKLSEILQTHGAVLLLYGFILVIVPLIVGYLMFRYVLHLPLLNGLGSITASMTSTPSLAVLIEAAGTDDVAAAYATTYPIALIVLVLLVQLLVKL